MFSRLAITCLCATNAFDIDEVLARLMLADEGMLSTNLLFPSPRTPTDPWVASMQHLRSLAETSIPILAPFTITAASAVGSDQSSTQPMLTMIAELKRRTTLVYTGVLPVETPVPTGMSRSSFCSTSFQLGADSNHTGFSNAVMPVSHELAKLLHGFQVTAVYSLIDNFCGRPTSWSASVWSSLISTIASSSFSNPDLTRYISDLISSLMARTSNWPVIDDLLPPPAAPVGLQAQVTCGSGPCPRGALLPGEGISFTVGSDPGYFMYSPVKRSAPAETLSVCQPGYRWARGQFYSAPPGHWADVHCDLHACPGFGRTGASAPVFVQKGLKSVNECLTTYECVRDLYYPDLQGGCLPLPQTHYFDYSRRSLSRKVEGDLFSVSPTGFHPVSFNQLDHFQLQSKSEAGLFFRANEPSADTLWSMSFGLEVTSPLPTSGAAYTLFRTDTFSIGVVPGSEFRTARLTVRLGRATIEPGPVTVETGLLNWDLGRRYDIQMVVSGGVYLLRNGELVGVKHAKTDDLMINLSRGISKGIVAPEDSVSFQVFNLDFFLGAFPFLNPPKKTTSSQLPDSPDQPTMSELPLVYFSLTVALLLIGAFLVVYHGILFYKFATRKPCVNPEVSDPNSQKITDAIEWV